MNSRYPFFIPSMTTMTGATELETGVRSVPRILSVAGQIDSHYSVIEASAHDVPREEAMLEVLDEPIATIVRLPFGGWRRKCSRLFCFFVL